MSEAILGVICLAQFGVIYALVNRLLVQSGARRMTPQDAVGLEGAGSATNPSKIVKNKIVSGSVRINP